VTVYYIDQFSTFYDAYEAMNPPSNITAFQLGGRLIPRSLVESDSAGLTAALRNANNMGAVISGVSVNVTRKPDSPSNSVNPAWRAAVMDLLLGT
jgi:hypothetical protein